MLECRRLPLQQVMIRKRENPIALEIQPRVALRPSPNIRRDPSYAMK